VRRFASRRGSRQPAAPGRALTRGWAEAEEGAGEGAGEGALGRRWEWPGRRENQSWNRHGI